MGRRLLGSLLLLLGACIEAPAPARVGEADAGGGLPLDDWLDGGRSAPAVALPIHPPDCAELDPGAGPPLAFDGGAATWLAPGDGGGLGAPGEASAVALARAPSAPGELLFTEVMADPRALADTSGEWVELYNPHPEQARVLTGCVFDDGGSPRTLNELVVGPGRHVTLARSGEPGFSPDLVLSFSLSNDADRLVLRCGGVEIDRVEYASAEGFPLAAGVSMALDPGLEAPGDNDTAAGWCLGQTAYGSGDLGTPGAPNADCFGDAGVE